jgi:hypothetical protein
MRRSTPSVWWAHAARWGWIELPRAGGRRAPPGLSTRGPSVRGKAGSLTWRCAFAAWSRRTATRARRRRGTSQWRADGGRWNVFSVRVADPQEVYHLNARTAGDHCWPSTTRPPSPSRAARPSSSGRRHRRAQVRNFDGVGTPIVVPGVNPAPQAFDSHPDRRGVDRAEVISFGGRDVSRRLVSPTPCARRRWGAPEAPGPHRLEPDTVGLPKPRIRVARPARWSTTPRRWPRLRPRSREDRAAARRPGSLAPDRADREHERNLRVRLPAAVRSG